MTDSPFLMRLATGQVLLLDGATGTELQRRGVDTSLPLWSARALLEASATQVLRAIHADYIAAGADIITTNTFRTHRRTLTQAGQGERTAELTHFAVRLAREAAQQADREVFVAGSIAPLEDCYSPQLVPPNGELWIDHAETAHQLAQAGCDLLLIETMNTIREAVIAARCAAATGLPVCVSFVVGLHGLPPDQIDRVGGDEGLAPLTLLSGESISEAVQAVQPIQPAVILINCVPLAYIDRAFDELRTAHHGPIGLYANVGYVDDQVGWTLTDEVRPAAYAQQARYWMQHGAAVIGGCCGTTPEHIAALKSMLPAA
ncbi:MAG TPA: homocysteine S-methyltransferase family protein [Anaerolineae bacterium]|nr:homocysteine S-methyltransferase family protein [Anaerolineae bacterium]